METSSSRKKNIIKNVIIVFLALMLVLTFFSSTIRNYLLPEVSAQYAYGDSIITRVRGSGVVTAVENYEVTIDEDRTIAGVVVRQGDRVAKGDVLFVLEDQENPELVPAIETLTSLKNEYNIWKIELDADYESRRYEIDSKNKELSVLLGLSSTVISLETAKADLDRAKAEVANLEKELSGYSYAAAVAAYESAKAELGNAQYRYDNAKSAFDKCAEQYDYSVELLEDFKENYYADRVTANDIKVLQNELKRLKEEYEDYLILNDLTDLAKAYEEAKEAYTLNANETTRAAYEAALRALNENSSTVISYLNRISDAENQIADKTIEMNAYSTYINGLERYEDAVKSAEDKKNSAEETLNGRREELENAKLEKDNAYNTMIEAKATASSISGSYSEKELSDMVDNLKKRLDKANQEKNSAEATYNILAEKSSEYQNEELYNKAVENLKQEIKSLETSLSNYEMKNDIYESEKLNAISKQQKVVDELRANASDSVIEAKIAGQVSRINCVAGQKVLAGTTLTEIEIVDKGYTVQFSVTADQAKRIAVGSEAKPQYYWGDDMNAYVESITADPSNPGQSKLVTIAINGNVYPGDTLTFNIGEKSVYYDCVVPNSAIREDSNGKFVLVIEAKETPLGSRYTARRVDINVTLADDTKSAVTGLAGGEFVITTSTTPITAGMQVRLSEY